MAYPTLTEVKEYLGITGTLDDTYLTATLAAVIDAVEQYCQRVFPETVGVSAKVFNAVQQNVFYLPQYPVDSVQTLTVDGDSVDITDIVVNGDLGKVTLSSTVTGDEVEFSYTGGFDPVPAVVTHVIMECVKTIYGNKDADSEVGSIKSERIDGVATIAYNPSSFSTGMVNEYISPIIGHFASALDQYMSESAIGSSF